MEKDETCISQTHGAQYLCYGNEEHGIDGEPSTWRQLCRACHKVQSNDRAERRDSLCPIIIIIIIIIIMSVQNDVDVKRGRGG